MLIASIAMLTAPMAPALAHHNANHGDEQAAHAGMNHAQPDAMATDQMLRASTPANGATLAQAPRTLALSFTHPVVLQTVAITGPGGAPVRGTFRRPSGAATSYAVALPALTSGAYLARWTASGQGHTMNGVIRFSVR
jgi:copper transport protein